MADERVSAARIFGYVAVAWGALFTTMLAGRAIADTTGAGPTLTLVLRGVVPATFAIAATIACEVSLSKRSLAESIASLGLAHVDGAQLGVAVASMVPLALAYGIIFIVLKVPVEIVRPFTMALLKYALAQGIAEELLFRGFAFRRLREGRTFGRAALLSAVVFALVHLTNLVKGLSAEVVVGMAISTVFAFVLAFPFALLFERGRRSLWGVALLHLAIDSNNFFPRTSESVSALVVYVFVGAFGALGVTTVLFTRLGKSGRFVRSAGAGERSLHAEP